METQKTVTITMSATGGRPAVIRWSGRGSGTGRGHKRRFRGRGRVAGVKINGSKKAKEAAKKPVSNKSVPEKKVVVEKKIEKKVEKKVEKNVEKNKLKKGSAKDEKPAVVPAVVKDTGKPTVIEKVVKKPVEKPVVKKEETIPEKGVVEKVVPEKQEEAVKEAASDVVEIEVGSEDVPSDEASDDGDDFDDGGEDGEISRDEYALMCAVGRAWRPPRGLKPGLSARLIVAISAQGRAERVDITSSSRVPAYDIAARASLYRAEYPPVFWGKNIAVVFGQAVS